MTGIWALLPFQEMLSHRTKGERHFIDPVVSPIEGGYTLVFYANRETVVKLDVFIGKTSGLIEASQFFLCRRHKNPRYCVYKREEGESMWHNYCLVFYRLLYNDFLL